MLAVSDAWRQAYPTASAGILLLSGVKNLPRQEALDRMKTALEEALRTEFHGVDRPALRSMFPFREYDAYFRQFGKTYHVQLQVESIVHKGRSIPHVAALVEAMFMAELKNRLLTAGHDAEAVRGDVRLSVASGNESYVMMNGRSETPKRGDMFMADDEGIISSVLYGPDSRTQLVSETTRVAFAVYGAPGIGADSVRNHLLDIAAYARLIAPAASVDDLEVVGL